MATKPETYGAMPATGSGYMRQSQLIPAIFPFSSATLWRKVKRRLSATRGDDRVACVLSEKVLSSGHQSRRRQVLLSAYFVMT